MIAIAANDRTYLKLKCRVEVSSIRSEGQRSFES